MKTIGANDVCSATTRVYGVTRLVAGCSMRDEAPCGPIAEHTPNARKPQPQAKRPTGSNAALVIVILYFVNIERLAYSVGTV